MQLEVEESPEGDQLVRLATDVPGKLVLHWGVEGGQSAKKAGWVLPPDSCRPEGTVAYKKRALQTPWKCAPPPPPACVLAASLSMPRWRGACRHLYHALMLLVVF